MIGKVQVMRVAVLKKGRSYYSHGQVTLEYSMIFGLLQKIQIKLEYSLLQLKLRPLTEKFRLVLEVFQFFSFSR